MTERSFAEIAFDPAYMRSYLALRVDIIDGEEKPFLIDYGPDGDEVHAAMMRDREVNETNGSRYHFYRPAVGADPRNRESWIFGGNE